jgi:dTDP-glucose 4,6-dehydratase
MKIVYVTGCLGFIGSYVTRACLKNGWYVRGIDKCTYAANEELIEEFLELGKTSNGYNRFCLEYKDICDIKFLYDCDYIINTAAETHVQNSIVKSQDFVHSNIDGVHNLLNLIRNCYYEKMPTLLHFSTDEVYGDIEQGFHTEKDLLKPSNPYSATKAAGDMLILAWARTYKIPYIIVRPTNNYGIGQYPEKLIPKTIKYLNLNRPIPLHNNGTPIRNWLHALDTARAIITIIESGVQNEIFNIAGHFEQSNRTTVEKIIKEYYRGCPYDTNRDLSGFMTDEKRQGQDVRYAIDDRKLQLLGWEPKCVFDKELLKIVKYYKERFIW